MAKNEKINYKKFSLWVTHGKYRQKIEIPTIHTKIGLNTISVGGKETYLMAIDHLTTKFNDADELLNYIRNYNLAKIKTLNNDEIGLEITYEGPYYFDGNLSLIYKDNKELVDFINHNPIKGKFEPYNPYVLEFQNEFLKKWNTSAEYRMFMTDKNNPYYSSDLPLTLDFSGEELLNKKEYTIGPFLEYHNIRGNCLVNQNLETELRQVYMNKIVPFNEKNEIEKELTTSKSNLRTVKMPPKKAKITKEPVQLMLFDLNDYDDKAYYSGNFTR